jgi:hypothetical protein
MSRFVRSNIGFLAIIALWGGLLVIPASEAGVNRVASYMKKNTTSKYRRYVVASPRASMASVPSVSSDVISVSDAIHPRMTGATYNFPIKDSTVTMRYGSTIFVQLSDTIEGVWYNKTNGWLGALIILDKRSEVDSTSNAVWNVVGRKGAAALRRGPSIGTARNLGVRFRPTAPGNYVLRARIYTYSIPVELTEEGAFESEDLETPEGPRPTHPRQSISYDEVYIKLRVVRKLSPSDTVSAYKEPIKEMPREDLLEQTDL